MWSLTSLTAKMEAVEVIIPYCYGQYYRPWGHGARERDSRPTPRAIVPMETCDRIVTPTGIYFFSIVRAHVSSCQVNLRYVYARPPTAVSQILIQREVAEPENRAGRLSRNFELISISRGNWCIFFICNFALKIWNNEKLYIWEGIDWQSQLGRIISD